MKPTEEQIKKFWEWCGFTIGDYPEPKVAPDEKAWYDPSGQFFCGLHNMLPIDLNNLFKYAVPKLGDIDGFAVWESTDGWVWEIIDQMAEAAAEGIDKDPALALFWAIWKVIDEN